jgi:hypothetical protein
MTEDERQLDLLSTFHYIVGGIAALFACFPLIHVAIGLMMVFSDFNGDAPPPFFGWLFVGLGGMFILLGWAIAVLIIIAGKKLRKRTSRTYCLVVGGLECLMMPFGTILGVFTIITLTKDSVRKLFESGSKPGLPEA